MITIEQMVQREVSVCLSSLVSTLASGYGNVANRTQGAELVDLCEQAFELASPIPDYEESAIQEGWKVESNMFINHRKGEESEASPLEACGWENLCSEYDIEPYDREVYEFWAVSTWFAEKLIEQGEKVDTDFAGMNVWARTCSGQGIASDGVIERIYQKMIARLVLPIVSSQTLQKE